jgi:hypothetical protein
MERRDFLKATIVCALSPIKTEQKPLQTTVRNKILDQLDGSDPKADLEKFRALVRDKKTSTEEATSLANSHTSAEVRLEAFTLLYNLELLNKNEALKFAQKHQDAKIQYLAFQYLYNKNLLNKKELEKFCIHGNPEIRETAQTILATRTDLPEEKPNISSSKPVTKTEESPEPFVIRHTVAITTAISASILALLGIYAKLKINQQKSAGADQQQKKLFLH